MGDSPWQNWVGREDTSEDIIQAVPAKALAATLNRTDLQGSPGEAIPPLWIWLSFLPLVPMAQIGPDGHPQRGGFLPPISEPRRMWAGSRCRFHVPLRIGSHVSRRSVIQSVTEKTGKTGRMVFVTVGHSIKADGVLAIEETQDIVYMPIPEKFSPPAPVMLPACDWREPLTIDPVLLFRFSALTFNGHRIHYDRPYAVDAEKYPGLVVHGPLQAILLFEAALRHAPGRAPLSFQFRGLRPLFDFDDVSVNGRATDRGLDLFTANGDGAIGMQASLEWAPV
ncbi:MAG: acyl-CoA dehydrogenase [Alphaproteobacteria bacterium]|nr:acyl-CoA dehydrogenase [Alphaproteobacteria bacterium]